MFSSLLGVWVTRFECVLVPIEFIYCRFSNYECQVMFHLCTYLDLICQTRREENQQNNYLINQKNQWKKIRNYDFELNVTNSEYKLKLDTTYWKYAWVSSELLCFEKTTAKIAQSPGFPSWDLDWTQKSHVTPTANCLLCWSWPMTLFL